MFCLLCVSLWAGALLFFICGINTRVVLFFSSTSSRKNMHSALTTARKINKDVFFYISMKLKSEARGTWRTWHISYFSCKSQLRSLSADCDNNQVKAVLGSLPVYIWWTVWNTQSFCFSLAGVWTGSGNPSATPNSLESTLLLLKYCCVSEPTEHIYLLTLLTADQRNGAIPLVSANMSTGESTKKKKKKLGLNKQHAANLCILKQLTVPHMPDRWPILGHTHIISTGFLAISLLQQVTSHFPTWNP